MKADSKTHKGVVATLERFSEAYARRDLKSLMATIAPDGDVILYGTGADEKRVGRKEIELQATRDWAQTEAASIVFEAVSVSGADSVAWAAVDGAFAIRASGQDMRLPARITFVLENRNGSWLIVQMHFSSPSGSQAPGASF